MNSMQKNPWQRVALYLFVFIVSIVLVWSMIGCYVLDVSRMLFATVRMLRNLKMLLVLSLFVFVLVIYR